jgi:hypothetical protein
MDPNATLIRLLEAIDGEDYHGAKMALNDLSAWIHKGGFKPNIAAAIEALKGKWQGGPINDVYG